MGHWLGCDGVTVFIVSFNGTIQYKTPGYEISGMGMSGWNSGRIRGNILCFHQEFTIDSVDDNTITLNGMTFRKRSPCPAPSSTVQTAPSNSFNDEPFKGKGHRLNDDVSIAPG